MNRAPYVIEKFRAFVSVDDDGDEGLCAFFNAESGQWLPLIAADEKRFADLERLARIVAKKSGRPVHIIEYSTRKPVGVIQP